MTYKYCNTKSEKGAKNNQYTKQIHKLTYHLKYISVPLNPGH